MKMGSPLFTVAISLCSAMENYKKKDVKRENKVLLNFFRQHVKADSLILDVGCGLGRNMTLLKKYGYANIIGTDISQEMLDLSKGNGHSVCVRDGLKKYKNKFDVILFSHVLEHIEYSGIQETMESYFEVSKPDALVIICMPLLYDGFYDNVDHIKPYYAKGLVTLFSGNVASKQYLSKYRLKLIDLSYLRSSLLPYHLKCRHIRSVINFFILGALEVFFVGIKLITLGAASKVVSYVAVFQLEPPR